MARPSPQELSAVPHHFIANRTIANPYNPSQYEDEALALLSELYKTHDDVIACGGSGLYIDALCVGMARMPDPSPQLRARLKRQILDGQLPQLCKMLEELDPEYYHRVDLKNPVRVQRALEVILTTGRPYSQVVSQKPTPRPFSVVKLALIPSHAILRQRIDARVDLMFADGLLEEASQLYDRYILPHRHSQNSISDFPYNTLNTVGYSELFNHLDGHTTLTEAKQRIKYNTWHYAKKQLTWIARYHDVAVFDNPQDILLHSIALQP